MDSAKKTYSSRFVFIIMGVLMALAAAYMAVVIKKAPRTVESSKVGPFPELMDHLLEFHKNPSLMAEDGKVWDKESVSAVMAELTPYEGLAMKRSAEDFTLLAASKIVLDGRPLLQISLKHPEGKIFSLSMYPIAKRHFPKTRSFVYKDAWFFQYGKDLEGSPAPKESALPLLVNQDLNLIATNYGNDYYLMVMGDAPAQDLAKWLFAATTIFSPRK